MKNYAMISLFHRQSEIMPNSPTNIIKKINCLKVSSTFENMSIYLSIFFFLKLLHRNEPTNAQPIDPGHSAY